jgi:hypothetical protein
MGTMALNNFIYLVLALMLILGAVRIFHLLRARAMRGLAARWSFKYIGPSAPPTWWWNPPYRMGSPPVGTLHFHLQGFAIRQVWNVIEGQRNGRDVLIFDAIWGSKGGQPLTFIACKEEQYTFEADTLREKPFQSSGWTALSGTWLLWFSWTMGTRRIDHHLSGF